MNMKSLEQSSALRGAAGWVMTRRQRGASIVEFAIVSPFALLVIMALIQLGLMFIAKQIVNQAAFVAARAGAVQNAQVGPMKDALTKALIPFYQDTTNTSDYGRLFSAWSSAQADLLNPFNLDVTVLNPNSDVFDDFGLTDANNNTYIPNDSLEYRPHSVTGPKSGLSIQDANALKIRVTYAYELKVPLMQSVFKSVMCGFDTGVDAFGRGGGLFSGVGSAQDCLQYYDRGRVPIVSYATVQMQSPAWKS
jgi:Flp pilus assembly protein TadG